MRQSVFYRLSARMNTHDYLASAEISVNNKLCKWKLFNACFKKQRKCK